MEFSWDLFYSPCLQEISSEVAKFADVKKLFKIVRKRADCEEFRKDETE